VSVRKTYCEATKVAKYTAASIPVRAPQTRVRLMTTSMSDRRCLRIAMPAAAGTRGSRNTITRPSPKTKTLGRKTTANSATA